LGSEMHSTQGSHFGELFKSSLWIGKPTKDERLHKHGSAQFRAPLHKVRQLCGFISGIGQQSLHYVRKAWYTGHKEAPFGLVVIWTITFCQRSFPLSLFPYFSLA